MSCQACNAETSLVFSAGYLPPCNSYQPIGSPEPVTTYATDLYFCDRCGLAQLGCVPPQTVTFPASYPYLSSTTRILRDNFSQLYEETQRINPLGPDDLVIDIGGNDGNLLSNWVGKHRVLNVTPEDAGKIGEDRGIPWLGEYWCQDSAEIAARYRTGGAKLITATNVFAHVPDLHDFLDGVDVALAPGGMFVSESHYLPGLLRNVQYDTLYGEHARYLSLQSIDHQLAAHGFVIIGARSIPTHGGSIRVYAMRKGEEFDEMHLRSGAKLVESRVYRSEESVTLADFATFRERVTKHRHDLRRVLGECRSLGLKVAGLGAPSRASTMVSYCGLSVDDVAEVYEHPSSHKVGHWLPGTRIPVVAEPERIDADVLVMFNHHIAREMTEKVRAKGFAGRFVIPLPDVVVE
jgi:hypothetical protein